MHKRIYVCMYICKTRNFGVQHFPMKYTKSSVFTHCTRRASQSDAMLQLLDGSCSPSVKGEGVETGDSD